LSSVAVNGVVGDDGVVDNVRGVGIGEHLVGACIGAYEGKNLLFGRIGSLLVAKANTHVSKQRPWIGRSVDEVAQEGSVGGILGCNSARASSVNKV